jgi:Protein of unknown function (DUF3489)
VGRRVRIRLAPTESRANFRYLSGGAPSAAPTHQRWLHEGAVAAHASPPGSAAKRLLALWNALPGVEKQTKVGDRDTLIDQLWSAIEALPDPEQPSDTKRPSKQEAVIAMLQRPEGATVDEVASVMGWQRHTVRGLFSGTLKKKLGLTLASATEERGRVYRIAAPEQA